MGDGASTIDDERVQARPRGAARASWRALVAVHRRVTRGLTLVALLVVYVLVLGPTALLVRLLRRDLLDERWPGPEGTAWRPREGRPLDLDHLRRQH